ncbi:glycerate kinase [Colletotrichum orchidophilum]|uniref:Glycerate kinase n=1 Tax=Colletotrichum orchidophilum TaxID=1209926 RepID=A0A1G4ARW1_9PEZI|nr:glycerate kinase [Colletotrichum orchidophilum]OHE91846.1 glycerate kinase [Colletotrichum orchidophilum]
MSKTAAIEMAAVAGLSLILTHLRDPGRTSNFEIGELLATTLSAGEKLIAVGYGDSDTCDGVARMLQTLGAQLVDEDGHSLPIAAGGKSLLRLRNIDLGSINKRVKDVTINVAVNWYNMLPGSDGVARVFAVQSAPVLCRWSGFLQR